MTPDIPRALGAAWRALQGTVPDLPNVRIIIGSGEGPPTVLAAVPPEVFIPEEALKCGADTALQVLAHEAAHLVAEVREIDDTSCEGRYHNRKFATVAGEFGFSATHLAPGDLFGFFDLTPNTVSADRYNATLDRLRRVLPAPDQPEHFAPRCRPQRIPRPGRAGSSARCSCDPPIIIRAAPVYLDRGVIRCDVCKALFMIKRGAS